MQFFMDNRDSYTVFLLTLLSRIEMILKQMQFPGTI